jgi:Smg protein
MKAEVLDILMYLFETYLDDNEADIPNEKSIRGELANIGFKDTQVSKAFSWLDELAILKDRVNSIEQPRNTSFRHFNSLEIKKFDTSAQSILLELVQLGVVTLSQREIIIDKALTLDIPHINDEQMKWVVLMVLFNLPNSAGSFTWVQDLLYQETPTQH